MVNFSNKFANSKWFLLIPITLVMIAVVSAPLSGWLADAKFGNYKTFRVGVALLFISAVLNCSFLILEALVWERSNDLEWIHASVTYGLFVVGLCMCTVTTLPLGLDQMPDASSSSITSFIAWFVCTYFLGFFVYKMLDLVHDNSKIKIIFSLICCVFSTFCLSIVLISSSLFSPKWLIIEPRSPQSLKAIYQVLKFAVKHKAPLNRSAFTYWEEDIPSRMDLGKSKYGGPFTTEQVEDVKTVLRLMVICSPIFFVLMPSNFHLYLPNSLSVNFSKSIVKSFVFELFLHSSIIYVILTTLAIEFLVYPVSNNILPSILKRIGAVPLIFTFISFACLILELTHYLSNSSGSTTIWIVCILYSLTNGILFQVLFTSLLEFMCAQSPYHMRGMLVSFILPLITLTKIVDWKIGDAINHKLCCSYSWCPLISYSMKTLTCFIGFLLFCVVARWYKMRVRDEDYSLQRVVEEVYDRYLTAAAQSRHYDTININN